MFGTAKSPFSPSSCNFGQATNKMEVTMAKPHPSVGKKDPPRNKVIPKDLGWNKKKGDAMSIQALGYGLDDCTKGSSLVNHEA